MNFKNFVGASPLDGGGADGRLATNFPLARQASVYSLTFEELQNTFGGNGKEFGSMNMDELLKNIWTVEDDQTMLIPSTNGGEGSTNLQKQGSLTLPRTLSSKTVDEVWRDLYNENGDENKIGNGNGGSHFQPRQPTFGETTLEEFLVRAGVVREETQPVGRTNNGGFFNELSQPNNNNNSLTFGFTNNLSNNQSPNLPFNVNGVRSSYQQPLLQSPMNYTVGLLAQSVKNNVQSGGIGIPADVSGGKNLKSSSVSPIPYGVSGGLRGRKNGGPVEKVVERRQKRMIKNRESAARSRARKQAYTLELEEEVAKLKEANQDLQKKQAKVLQMQKIQTINQQRGGKRRCLRRTLTGPW